MPLLYDLFRAQPLIKDPQSSINQHVSHQPFICSLLSLRPTRRASDIEVDEVEKRRMAVYTRMALFECWFRALC